MKVIRTQVAGIDVHKEIIVLTILTGAADQISELKSIGVKVKHEQHQFIVDSPETNSFLIKL